jgi:hypothetical protein
MKSQLLQKKSYCLKTSREGLDMLGCPRTGALTEEPTSSTFAMKKVLPVQPLHGHALDPDEPGIFDIILGAKESRVSTPLLGHAPDSWLACRPSYRTPMGT